MIVKPEEVGLSSQRLDRVRAHVQPYIDAGKVAGTLTLVARRGHIAYCEPQGHLELEGQRPMQPDTIFRIYSMSKPITSVALMMLYEQGLFQLDDPVHKFIPAWENLQVYVSGDHPAFVTAPPAILTNLATQVKVTVTAADTDTPLDRLQYQLRVDDSAWTAPMSGTTLSFFPSDYQLQDTLHQVQVRAVDPSLLVDLSPATAMFDSLYETLPAPLARQRAMVEGSGHG